MRQNGPYRRMRLLYILKKQSRVFRFLQLWARTAGHSEPKLANNVYLTIAQSNASSFFRRRASLGSNERFYFHSGSNALIIARFGAISGSLLTGVKTFIIFIAQNIRRWYINKWIMHVGKK
jgi:hypothetical protein